MGNKLSHSAVSRKDTNNDEPHTVWMVERERGEMGGIPNIKRASPSTPHKMSDKDDNRFYVCQRDREKYRHMRK